MKKLLSSLLIIVLLASILLTGCATKEDIKTGELSFVANGEDFTRQGFTSKDGWNITFDHIYVTLSDITTYQTNPPYDSHSREEIKSETKISLDGIKTIDLAEGDKNATLLFLGKVEKAPVGHYNAMSWKVVNGSEGEAKDNVFVFIGKAEKDGKILDFNIKFNKEYKFLAGEYVGDLRKGIVDEGKNAELEMTFHFDHLFGDIETDINDSLNQGALGFEPFAKFVNKEEINVDINDIKASFTQEEFDKLLIILPTLGHVGEGHCHSEEL